MRSTLSSLKNKLIYFLMPILIASVCLLGYDNYKAHERVAELEAASMVRNGHLYNYMVNFAKCRYMYKQLRESYEAAKCKE